MLDIHTSAGPRTLRLGEGFRVAPTPTLRAELDHILGPAPAARPRARVEPRTTLPAQAALDAAAAGAPAGRRTCGARAAAAPTRRAPRRRSSRRRAPLVRPGVSRTHGRPVEARLGEEHRAALRAELALADVGVAVAVGPQRRLAVVEVQRAEPVEADEGDAVVERRRQRPRRCGCRSPRRAGGTSPGTRPSRSSPPATPRAAPRAPRTSARASRPRRPCSRGAAGSSRLRQRLGDDLRPRARSPRRRRPSSPSPGGARRRVAPSASPALQRRDERRQRLRRGSPGRRARG